MPNYFSLVFRSLPVSHDMIKKKKTLLTSGILSFVIPGTGQAYLGYWRLGLAWYGLGIVWWLIFLNLMCNSFRGLIALLGGLALWWFCGICHTFWLVFRARLASRYFWHFIGFCIIFHCTFLLLAHHSFPLKLYKVPSISMEPTLNVGDYFMASNEVPDIQRGTIIVFFSPKGESVVYVKRVTGMPGEIIRIKNGDVFINNQKLSESYLVEPNNRRGAGWGQMIAEGIDFTIPMDTFFVLGDNRNDSYDSRFFGPVPFSGIIGQARYILISKNGGKTGAALQ